MELCDAWQRLSLNVAGFAASNALVFCGWVDGLEGIQQRVADLDDAFGNAVFAGPQYGDDKWRSLFSATFMILPSKSEGLPLAIVEAWAAGAPVIMTDECNLPEGFEAGAAIRISADIDGIAAGLACAHSMDVEGRQRMKNNALSLVLGKFSCKSVVDAIIDIYQSTFALAPNPSCGNSAFAAMNSTGSATSVHERRTHSEALEPNAADETPFDLPGSTIGQTATSREPGNAVPIDASKVNARLGGPSFGLQNRIYRQIWSLVWGLFGAWTPKPLHGWRRFLLRLFGARLGRGAKVYPGVSVWMPSNLVMGDYACLGAGVRCYSMATIRLDAFALVSQGAHLCAGTHDIDDPHFQLQVRPITIARNAWVAADAFVGPGVTINEGAVLGARSVLFKDLAAGAVAVGNPARVVRYRAGYGVTEVIGAAEPEIELPKTLQPTATESDNAN